MGGRRFRVTSRGMRDGYNTAKVENIRDEPELDPQALQSESTFFCTPRLWSIISGLWVGYFSSVAHSQVNLELISVRYVISNIC